MLNCYDAFSGSVDANERVDALHSELQNAIDNFVPIYARIKPTYPSCYSDPLIRALSEKDKFKQKYCNKAKKEILLT